MGKILCVIILLVTCFSAAEAQINSAAFDPNCYQPRLGVPSEIDSTYGSNDHQYLGAQMYAFPPSKDFPAGRVGISGLPDNPLFLSYQPKSPAFNIHDLQAKAKKTNINWTGNPPVFKHFHNSKLFDMFFPDQRKIYWADENGDYDSARYTVLNPKIIGTRGNGYTSNGEIYSTYLTSDSVCDFIRIIVTLDTPIGAKLYFTLTHGGEHLFAQGQKAFADSTLLIPNATDNDTILNKILQTHFLQGNFRGTGREDLITKADSGNWFFFKNDLPFTMAKFVDAILNDTLMATWENDPQKNNFLGAGGIMSAFVGQILPHAVDDKSEDIIFPMENGTKDFGRSNIQLVLRGSPNFGQSRIYLAQAEQVLHNPWYYDNSFDQMTLDGRFADAGDMTSLGYKVLYNAAAPPGGSYQFFYVTGKAIDDKADAFYYYSTPGFTENPIPLDADGDKYGDLLLSDPVYASADDTKSYVGTIHLLHGSNKIPVHLNPKYSVEERKAVDRATWHIVSSPNPCDEKTVLTFDNCTTSRMRIQVYSTDGVLVQEEETPAVDGLQQYALYLPSLSPGMYVVRLSCPALGWTGSVNIVKTGAAVKPWSLDLKKMVGR